MATTFAKHVAAARIRLTAAPADGGLTYRFTSRSVNDLRLVSALKIRGWREEHHSLDYGGMVERWTLTHERERVTIHTGERCKGVVVALYAFSEAE